MDNEIISFLTKVHVLNSGLYSEENSINLNLGCYQKFSGLIDYSFNSIASV